MRGGARPDDYVFKSQTGGPLDPDNIDRTFNAHLRLAGLPGFRVHDLRHSAATHMLNAGIPMKTVQVFLRHADFRTTANVYGHLLSSSLDEVGERLSAFVQRSRHAEGTSSKSVREQSKDRAKNLA